MRLVNIAALGVTVELSIADCLCLYAALAHEADRSHSTAFALCEALGNALIGQAFAAFILAEPDPPLTLRHMWAMWAPGDDSAPGQAKIAPPAWLPAWRDEAGDD